MFGVHGCRTMRVLAAVLLCAGFLAGEQQRLTAGIDILVFIAGYLVFIAGPCTVPSVCSQYSPYGCMHTRVLGLPAIHP